MPLKRMEWFRLLFEHLARIEHQFFELHKRFKEGRESVRDDEKCGRSKKVETPELIDQRVRVRVTMLRFAPVHKSILFVTFCYSLSSEAVGIRQLRKWKGLWRRSLTRSHKRTSMGPFRSCWNSKTSAFQPEEITSKGTSVS